MRAGLALCTSISTTAFAPSYDPQVDRDDALLLALRDNPGRSRDAFVEEIRSWKTLLRGTASHPAVYLRLMRARVLGALSAVDIKEWHIQAEGDGLIHQTGSLPARFAISPTGQERVQILS